MTIVKINHDSFVEVAVRCINNHSKLLPLFNFF